MYIIIGLGLICATIGFVVGSAVRWKIDYEAETIGSLIVAQADENENPSLFLNLGGESVDFADRQYVVLNAKLKDDYLRAYAELENTKKRCAAEMEKNSKY